MLARGSHTDLARVSRVLVAEHDPQLRAEMVAELRDHCEVIECADGAEALERTADLLLAGERLPDAFVLDVRMLYLSGIHVMCALRGCDRYVPIVLTTGSDSLETHSLADRFGAVLVEKPFDVRALCGAILEVSRDPAPVVTSRAYTVRSVRVERMPTSTS
jgi:DNA-binding response OmpR family regulator